MKTKGENLTIRFKMAWSSRIASQAILMLLMNSYVSYYATNFMMIPVGTVGIIFMVAKIFDGFTDILAGYIIDHTHTRWGKGRPYELALIGYWGCAVLLFCAPKMGYFSSCVYLFVMYSLINSVFYTLLTCSDAVYLANTVKDEKQVISLSSFQGIITMIATMVGTILLPQLASSLGTTKAGWGKILIMLAIPLTILGLVRFFAIPERQDQKQDIQKNDVKKIPLKLEAKALIKNKYALIVALFMLLANVIQNISASVDAYYYLYIFGDVGVASYGAVSVLSIIAGIILVPSLAKKIGFMRIIRGFVLISAIGYFIRFLAPANLFMIILTCFLRSSGLTTMCLFINVFLTECMDFGEWKMGMRTEGVIACVQSVGCKIGTAIGLGASGILLGIAGFSAGLAEQTEAVKNMLIALESVIPAIGCILVYILLRCYDLDKSIVRIRKELQNK